MLTILNLKFSSRFVVISIHINTFHFNSSVNILFDAALFLFYVAS